MKVYLVYQSSGDYEDYHETLCGVFSTMKLAQECKARNDGKVVCHEDLDIIMPENVYCSWPDEGEYLEDGSPNPYYNIFDDNEPVKEYEGHTLEEYQNYSELERLWYMNYRPAHIKEIEIDKDL